MFKILLRAFFILLESVGNHCTTPSDTAASFSSSDATRYLHELCRKYTSEPEEPYKSNDNRTSRPSNKCLLWCWLAGCRSNQTKPTTVIAFPRICSLASFSVALCTTSVQRPAGRLVVVSLTWLRAVSLWYHCLTGLCGFGPRR